MSRDVADVHSGDAGATYPLTFDEALTTELPRLEGLARRLLHGDAAAADLAQETAARALIAREGIRDVAALPAWLNRTLVNLVIDRSRRRTDELMPDDVEARWADDDYTVDPEAVIAQAELRDRLEDGLTRLPVDHRVVVVLHDASGWTSGEIAAALDIGVPAAKARLRRGRMMLVTALDENDPRRQASLAQTMRCWQARRHVSAYLDDELDATARQAVEAHLAECPTCPPLYAGLVGVRAALAGLRDPDSVVPENIAVRLSHAPAPSGANR